MTAMTTIHLASNAGARHTLRATLAVLLVSVSTVAIAQVQVAPAAKPPQAPGANPAPTAAPPRAPVAAVPGAPAAAPARAPSGDVVARAGDKELTRSEIRAFVSTLSANEQEALASDPALFSQTLRVMLANQLVLKEAMAKKWDEQPQIATQLKLARDNAVVESYLQSIATVPPEFPSEAELSQAYEANKAAFAVPRTFNVAQIFIARPENADKAAQDNASKKLADVQAKLTAPDANFAEIAKSASDEPASAARGGEIGWLAETQMKPDIRAQVLALSKGAVSAPIKSDGGWHIVKLLDTKEAGTRTLAEVKDALSQRLRAQRAEIARRAYLTKLLEQSPPTINELALTSVLERRAKQ